MDATTTTPAALCHLLGAAVYTDTHRGEVIEWPVDVIDARQRRKNAPIEVLIRPAGMPRGNGQRWVKRDRIVLMPPTHHNYVRLDSPGWTMPHRRATGRN